MRRARIVSPFLNLNQTQQTTARPRSGRQRDDGERFREYFDRVWIINLAERSDRRRRITRELERIGLPLTPGRVEIFPGIRKAAAEGFPSPGYHGCFLSHRGLFALGASCGAARVLVLEDDVVFHPDFKQREQQAVAELRAQPDWGLVHFGYEAEGVAPGRGLLPSPRTIVGSHFYAVNGPVLAPMRQWYDDSLSRPAGHPQGSRISPDGTMNHFRWAHPEVRAFVHAPILGRQWNSASDLANRHWIDRVPLLGGALRAAAQLLRSQRWD